MGYNVPVIQTHHSLKTKLLQIAYHDLISSVIYTYLCKYWRMKPSMDKTWARFRIFFVLEYNKLREEQRLNATQAGFHYANHTIEEEQYFSSELDNLALASFLEKDLINRLISSEKISTESKKTLLYTIASLI